MITKETIIDFFKNIEENEEFNSTDKLLWSYFFLNSDLERLKEFAEVLKGLGYYFVNIFEAEKENKNDIQEYYLQIEKIEYHNIDSLHRRNQYFDKLTEENNISFYDGFDVGNIINSESIVH